MRKEIILRNFIVMIIVGFLFYMIGYGNGQRDTYIKMTDDKSVDSLYTK